MEDLTTKIGIPSGAGILGMVFGWFGLKFRINRVEDRIDKLSENVVFTDVFETFQHGLKERLDSNENLLKESRKDIKEILGRLPK